MAEHRFHALHIHSYDELLRHEPEIIARIEQIPCGGNLFMAHPLRLLADVGVTLTADVEREILALHPELSGLSPVPYEALAKSTSTQPVQFRIRGLFRRRRA